MANLRKSHGKYASILTEGYLMITCSNTVDSTQDYVMLCNTSLICYDY